MTTTPSVPSALHKPYIKSAGDTSSTQKMKNADEEKNAETNASIKYKGTAPPTHPVPNVSSSPHNEHNSSAILQDKEESINHQSETASDIRNTSDFQPKDESINHQSETVSDIRNTSDSQPKEESINHQSETVSDIRNTSDSQPKEESINHQSETVSDIRNTSDSQTKEDPTKNDKTEIKIESKVPLRNRPETTYGGLRPGEDSAVIANPQPVSKSEKYKLVIIHCFASSKNTFTYSFKNGTVPQNSKSIINYVEVAEYLSIFICRKTYQELINRNGKC